MNNIVLVGGAGYIGSRLSELLSSRGIQHEVIDANVYGEGGMEDSLPALIEADYFKDKVVVWLASFHVEPEGIEIGPKGLWLNAYEDLMVKQPWMVSIKAKHLIYTSSMRAIHEPNPQPTIYNRMKRKGEERLLGWSRCNMSVLRFGTVWGDLRDPYEDFPNRPSTAVNFALTRGKFEGNDWSAYTTHMSDAIYALYDHIMHYEPGVMENITDFRVPTTAHVIRNWLSDPNSQLSLERQEFIESGLEGQIDLEQDKRGQERMARLYGLEMP